MTYLSYFHFTNLKFLTVFFQFIIDNTMFYVYNVRKGVI